MADKLAEVIARMAKGDPLQATMAAGQSRDAMIQEAQKLTPEQIAQLQQQAEVQRKLRQAQNEALLRELLNRHIGPAR